jgi:hypothetical protein
MSTNPQYPPMHSVIQISQDTEATFLTILYLIEKTGLPAETVVEWLQTSPYLLPPDPQANFPPPTFLQHHINVG